jgi:dihydrofolate synthase/folylpolyglutamate synthase
VVLYYQPDLVYNIVKQFSQRLGAELFYSPFKYELLKNDLTGMEFSFEDDYGKEPLVKLKLLGEYQISNAAVVLAAVHALRKTGIKISGKNVLDGLENTVWPGRMDVMNYKGKTIIFEGAHNAEGAMQLVRSMKTYTGGGVRKITLLAAVMKDKEYGVMMNGLAGISAQIVLTRPVYSGRAANVSKLYEAIDGKNKAGKTVVTERDCRRALELAVKMTPDDGIVLCTGSLYLVGDVRALVLGLGDRG